MSDEVITQVILIVCLYRESGVLFERLDSKYCPLLRVSRQFFILHMTAESVFGRHLDRSTFSLGEGGSTVYRHVYRIIVLISMC